MGLYFRIPLPGPFGYSVRIGGRRRRRSNRSRGAPQRTYTAAQQRPAYNPQPRQPLTPRQKRTRLIVGGLAGLIIAIIAISEAVASPSKPAPPSHPAGAIVVTSSSPAEASSPAAPPSPAYSPPAPSPTPAPAPVQTTQAAAPPPAASCYPLSDEGTCYEPGEFCRDDDHGETGVAGDGEQIECEDNDGWRWEPI